MICISLIDLLTKFEKNSNVVGKRYSNWLSNNITLFAALNPDHNNNQGNYKITLAYRFYEEFRCCIVHECRISNAGQFSYDYDIVLKLINDSERHIMVVNPKYLLISLKNIFTEYIEKLRNDKNEYENFQNIIYEDFKDDFEYSNRI